MNTDAIWYHYFDIRDNTGSKSTYRGFLLSLALQMGLESEGINPALHKLYKNSKGYQHPPIGELEEILEIIIKQRNAGYLFVDAMDECKEGVTKVMDWLSQFAQKLWIVVTSRHFADSRMKQRALEIVLSNEGHHIEKDMEMYLQSKIQSSEYNFNLNETYWEHVVKTLKDGAHGQFRWAECQLNELTECIVSEDVKKVLTNLPKGLEDIYSQAVQKVRRGNQATKIHHLLLWLLFAYRPLYEDEVTEILSIDVQKQTAKNDIGMRMNLHAIVDSNLVIIGSNKVVQFAHASVKEFLINYQTSNQVKDMFEINELLAHDIIAQACMIYLMDIENREGKTKRSEHTALLTYASHYWPVHAKCVEGQQQEKTLENLTKMILMDSSNIFEFWRELVDN
ncbi:hypothetical protein GYMLUDRAFT_949397 [Collybiopsis luxurians FD-317 M1]|nr:hypothetical protein GYMLUDRAFT_949397 [Collybiopsis luxurians FD-317 M1]